MEPVADPVVEAKSTFKERQDSYRENCQTFFQSKDHYQRLEKIVYSGKMIYPLLMHFITEFSKDRMFLTPNGAVCPRAAYTNALRSRKKRFYDFTGAGSRVGCGPLWYNGIHNPAVLANETNGSIALPIPLLVAIKWVIDEHFDTVFWELIDEIKDHFTAHTKARKEKYMNTHKKNKVELRKEVESVFIQQKKARIREMQQKQQDQLEKDGTRRKRRPGQTKPRRDTYLSRADRAQVAGLIEEEKKRRKEEAKRNTARKRRTNTGKAMPSYFVTDSETPVVQLPAAKPFVLHF